MEKSLARVQSFEYVLGYITINYINNLELVVVLGRYLLIYENWQYVHVSNFVVDSILDRHHKMEWVNGWKR